MDRVNDEHLFVQHHHVVMILDYEQAAEVVDRLIELMAEGEDEMATTSDTLEFKELTDD